MADQTQFVYHADGVAFTVYKTVKPAKSGPKTYGLLEDVSSKPQDTGRIKIAPRFGHAGLTGPPIAFACDQARPQ